MGLIQGRNQVPSVVEYQARGWGSLVPTGGMHEDPH